MELNLLKHFGKFFWLLLDFDRCIGDTFTPSPNEIGVKEAYGLALKAIFGTKLLGADPLAKINGLQNRAPTEVITSILNLGNPADLLAAAQDYFQQHAHDLTSYVPLGKGIVLEWGPDPLGVIAEMLVRVKLSILMKEIGPDWPKPCPGFLEFYQELKQLETPIGVSIVSSGHDEFIRATFAVWGCGAPPAMLTDDDLRNLSPGQPGPCKPNPRLVDLALVNWVASQGVKFDWPLEQKFIELAKKRAWFFGDDLEKDGGLAQNAGLPFCWFNPNGDPNPGTTKVDLIFTDWKQVIPELHLG